MDLLENMNRALTYIEEHLAEDIDFQEVARLAYCSEYHFKRMFSFLAGLPLSEYIRRRRLTLAAFELKDEHKKIIDIALKYGYQSPDSFTKAFQNLHGITPSAARKNGYSLKAYPRMTFQLMIKGGIEMKYRMEAKEKFRIVGLKNRINLVASGDNPEIVSIIENTPEEVYQQLEQLSDLKPSGVLHVTTNFAEDDSGHSELDYYLAAATTQTCPAHFTQLTIPALTWTVFEAPGSWPEVQEMWGRIYAEWFPTSGYEHVEGPEILCSVEQISEIWIPVRQTKAK